MTFIHKVFSTYFHKIFKLTKLYFCILRKSIKYNIKNNNLFIFIKIDQFNRFKRLYNMLVYLIKYFYKKTKSFKLQVPIFLLLYVYERFISNMCFFFSFTFYKILQNFALHLIFSYLNTFMIIDFYSKRYINAMINKENDYLSNSLL